ncbi:MAG: glycosyltransferase family 2 protein [Chloroflexota bacterium]|nr:glycosyltransferase family 2 protein [Chloroflexota bacterium]
MKQDETASEISAVVLAHNEARHLPDCLVTLHWADEMLVLDSGSTDGTSELARAAGARVEQRPFTHFGDLREAALRMATHPWVFFVDADERVPPALAEEVRRVVAEKRPEVGYWIPRRNYFWGKEVRYSGWAPDHQLRLLRRDAAHYDPTQHVHEVAELDGPAGYLANPMLHINYDSWGEFWRKQERYAHHEGTKLAARGVRWKPWSVLLQPLRAFHRRFVAWQGWKDGLLGLQLSLAMAWWEGVAYLELRRQTTPE